MDLKNRHINISVSKQQLSLFDKKDLFKVYRVSTAKNGLGELMGSECTPRGKHVISEKIGGDSPVNSVFVGRRSTGEIYGSALRTRYPDRDWILTRILRLRGTEEGKNKGGKVDSYDRYIYIHGTPDDVEIEKRGSRGCLRMQNDDIIELFNLVDVGTTVVIDDD